MDKIIFEVRKDMSNLFVKLNQTLVKRDAILIDIGQVQHSLRDRGKILPFRRMSYGQQDDRDKKED